MPALRKPRTKPAAAQPFLQDVPPVSPPEDSFPDRTAMICEAAYFRAEKRSFAPGHELEDWLAAEREVDAMLVRGNHLARRD
jgi:hypothetical protein